LFFLLGISGVDAASFSLVVNASNPVETLTKQQVSDLFLKKVREWEDGSSVAPVDQEIDAAIRATFSEAIHGRPPTAIRAYWQQKVFAGRDVPPPQKSSDEEVVEYVRSNAGAIGYVSAGTDVSGCKVVTVAE
jgi:ABC-type phosphate transport system substrate-binding protein